MKFKVTQNGTIEILTIEQIEQGVDLSAAERRAIVTGRTPVIVESFLGATTIKRIK